MGHIVGNVAGHQKTDTALQLRPRRKIAGYSDHGLPGKIEFGSADPLDLLIQNLHPRMNQFLLILHPEDGIGQKFATNRRRKTGIAFHVPIQSKIAPAHGFKTNPRHLPQLLP